MGLFHHESDEAAAHAQVEGSPHKAKLSHELIAAAASYEAAKAYHNHLEKNGKPASHEKAKEILAAASGFFIDRLVETKGLDHIDKAKAKHEAEKKLHDASAPHYDDY